MGNGASILSYGRAHGFNNPNIVTAEHIYNYVASSPYNTKHQTLCLPVQKMHIQQIKYKTEITSKCMLLTLLLNILLMSLDIMCKGK